VRSAVRYWIYPNQRAYYIGFRVARDLESMPLRGKTE